MRYEIVFSGSGGQGMILSGKITAEAAATIDKKYSTQTQSYGPESRGGMSEAYVIISEDPVDYPEITKADVVVALSQSGLTRQIPHIDKDTIVIIDEDKVDASKLEVSNIYKMPFTKISKEVTGKAISANVVSLGALTKITQKVSKEGMIKTIRKNVPNGTEDKNQEAFEKGYNIR